MYAINHAATALILKKKSPSSPLLPLLISGQVVELLWVIFNYIGIEHTTIIDGKLHLDYLPYSHSVLSGFAMSLLSFAVINWGLKNRSLAIFFAMGVLSHTLIDIVFHENDIALSPFNNPLSIGLGIIKFPYLDFILETGYGLFCWWYFRGKRALLLTILIFNILDLPMMFAKGDIVKPFADNHFLLPSVILFQILITWYFVWKYGTDSNSKKPVKAN